MKITAFEYCLKSEVNHFWTASTTACRKIIRDTKAPLKSILIKDLLFRSVLAAISGNRQDIKVESLIMCSMWIFLIML